MKRQKIYKTAGTYNAENDFRTKTLNYYPPLPTKKRKKTIIQEKTIITIT